MVRNGRTLINQTPADFTYSSNPDLCKSEDPSLAWNWTKTFSDNFNVYVGAFSELSRHFHCCCCSSIQQKQVSRPQSQCIPHLWIVRIPRRRHSRIHLWQPLPTLPRLRLASKGRGIIMVALTKVRRGHVERSLDHRIQEKLWRPSCVRTFAWDIHLLVLNTGKSSPTLSLLHWLTKILGMNVCILKVDRVFVWHNKGYCGYSLTNNGASGNITSPSKCSVPCAGSSSSICGGSWALSVFRTSSKALTLAATNAGGVSNCTVYLLFKLGSDDSLSFTGLEESWVLCRLSESTPPRHCF